MKMTRGDHAQETAKAGVNRDDVGDILSVFLAGREQRHPRIQQEVREIWWKEGKIREKASNPCEVSKHGQTRSFRSSNSHIAVGSGGDSLES